MILYVMFVILMNVVDKRVDSAGNVKTLVAEYIPSNDDLHASSIAISVQFTENLYYCLDYCLVDSNCVSVFFHDNTKACQTNNMEIGVNITSYGWKYYLITSRRRDTNNGWSTWSAWGFCSESDCGSGIRSRTRTGPQGNEEETEPCMNVCSSTMQVSTTSSHTYIGCFDGANALVLNGISIQDSALTMESCSTLCGKWYMYFGMKNGDQCWCDNSYINTKIADNNCMIPCAGNNLQTRCGGLTNVAVYVV